MTAAAHGEPALIHGPLLTSEPGLGALTLPGYLREVTQRFSEREALVFHEGGARISWSYALLWERAAEVARSLLSLGCGKDSRVGILMTNRPEWLAAVFGAAIAGCTAVPLSTFSTEPELDCLLRTAAVGVLLVEQRIANKDFVAMLARLEPLLLEPPGARSTRFPHLRHLALIGDAPAGSAFENWKTFCARGIAIPIELAERTAEEVRPTDIGAILFSSGSTATPKAIINSQRGVAIHLWRWRRMFALEGDIRAWTPNGFFWSGNFGTVLGATLSAGGCLVLQSIFEPVAALDLIAAERVNYPTAWRHQWKQIVEAPNWNDVDLSAVRFLGADQPLAVHPTIRLGDWHEPSSYGSTETFTITTGHASDATAEIAHASHGPALPGNTVKIIDPISGTILPRGEQGEIAVKGPTLMLGYLGVPPEQAFDAEGFYRTGDSGWIDNIGELHFEGRLSTVIKTGGANVSPLEVEHVLETMAGIKIARCVGVPDDALGELVVACIVPAEGAMLSAEAVYAFARKRLASYKTPRRILFLEDSAMQLTGSAKIKPAELRLLAIAKLAAQATVAA